MYAVPSPYWAFCVFGESLGKKTKFELNRIHLWGFRGLGGLGRTVVQELEEEVVAYLRWIRGSGYFMPRHAEPTAKSTCGKGWGLKKKTRNKKGF